MALVLALAGATSWGATTLPPASHAYGFDGDLTDELGGPPMTAIKGTIEATDLQFDRGGGARVDGAASADTYSIEMRVDLSLKGNGSSFYRLLDFKNRKTDNGLYEFNGMLDFYPRDVGTTQVFSPNTWADVVITRDGATKQVVGYVDGEKQFTFKDSADDAVFVRPNGLTRAIFFQDDRQYRGEDCSGFVDHIRFFDSVLTGDDARALANGVLPPNVTLQ
jgi:hypothetical protein